MNKNESRYFNTAVKMDEALLALLEKKDFEYITVKEICERAGVNRSTFYLHYENTADLLKEATKHVLDRFLSYFPVDGPSVVAAFRECELNKLVFITPEYLTPYLSFVKENRRVFKTAISQLGTMGFDRVYQRMFEHVFSPILERFSFPLQTRSYVMKFYLMGITAIVMEWVKKGCEDSVEEIGGVIIQCILGKQEFHG